MIFFDKEIKKTQQIGLTYFEDLYSKTSNDFFKKSASKNISASNDRLYAYMYIEVSISVENVTNCPRVISDNFRLKGY